MDLEPAHVWAAVAAVLTGFFAWRKTSVTQAFSAYSSMLDETRAELEGLRKEVRLLNTENHALRGSMAALQLELALSRTSDRRICAVCESSIVERRTTEGHDWAGPG